MPERPSAFVCDPHAGDRDRLATLVHALKLYGCEPAVDEIAHCLKTKPVGKQNIHVAATLHPGEHFKHPAMALADSLVLGLRGHFNERLLKLQHEILFGRPDEMGGW